MKTQIIPVIHYEHDKQALRNADIAFTAGCAGVFLIDMSGANDALPLIARVIKTRYPDKKIGINFLGMDPAEAVAANIENKLDMTWTDAQLSHSENAPWNDAKRVEAALYANHDHLMFAGVAFKHQAHESDPGLSARLAIDFGFVPTTSGPATGIAAEASKIANIRNEIGPDAMLAIASGITPDNVGDFAPHLSHILVATGVSSSFYEFDNAKLQALCNACDRAR